MDPLHILARELLAVVQSIIWFTLVHFAPTKAAYFFLFAKNLVTSFLSELLSKHSSGLTILEADPSLSLFFSCSSMVNRFGKWRLLTTAWWTLDSIERYLYLITLSKLSYTLLICQLLKSNIQFRCHSYIYSPAKCTQITRYDCYLGYMVYAH